MSGARFDRIGLPAPPLLVITDRNLARAPLDQVVAAAVAGGCRWLMVREKDLGTAALASLAATLVDAGRRHGATVLVNDDVEAARLAGAAGVHLPGDAGARNIAAARAALGAQALVGVSAHSAADVVAATAAGADYVTFSPVFESTSKPGYGPTDGNDGLAALAGAVGAARCPVIALGGVTPGNAASCRAAGAAGVAVLGAVMLADDPAAAVAALVAAIRGEAPPSP